MAQKALQARAAVDSTTWSSTAGILEGAVCVPLPFLKTIGPEQPHAAHVGLSCKAALCHTTLQAHQAGIYKAKRGTA